MLQILARTGVQSYVGYGLWESPEAIDKTLGDMGSLFSNDIREMPKVLNFAD